MRSSLSTSIPNDWVVYKLGTHFGWVGHRVKIHNITSATEKERGDLEIKDYVVMQKPQPQAVFTLAPCGPTHEHKTFRWCSWPRCVIERSDQNQNQTLPELVLESPGPYCIYTLIRGHYWTDLWWIYPLSIFAWSPWSIGFGWWKNRLCGFQYLWTFLLGLSYHFRVSFVHVVPHRF